MDPEVFVRAGLLDKEELAQVLREVAPSPNETFSEKVIRLGYCSTEDVAKALAMHHGIQYVDLRRHPISPAVTKAVPASLAFEKNLVPLEMDQHGLLIAVSDPNDIATLDLVAFLTGKRTRPCVASDAAIRETVSKIYGAAPKIPALTPAYGMQHTVEILESELLSGRDLQRLQSTVDKTAIVRLVDSIIHKSIMNRASDIHIEPQEGTVAVRNRIDGVLRDLLTLPGSIQPAVSSRFKIMAGMNIADRRVPQDGRIKVRVCGRVIDLRVSTLPTQYGEKVVVRVLSSENSRLAIGDVGLVPEHLAVLQEVIQQPQGMLIVAGPTGAGKTTTLYSLLAESSTGKTNIVTLEDPIEYVLPGVNQVQINEKAGLTFAKCLRSVLRQDPNVIFVGEIRDAETAEIAMRAALTGHFVYTTVHAGSVFGTVTRLVDLGIDPSLISSSVTAVMGQRLLRRICEKCRVVVEPVGPVFNRTGPVENRTYLRATGPVENRTYLQPEAEVDYVAYRGQGCAECGETGYRGRIATYEILRVNSQMRQLIHQGKVTESNLLACAREAGMRTMLEDALSKVRQGITTKDEVERVLCLLPEAGPGEVGPVFNRTYRGAGGYRILLVEDDVELFPGLVRALLENGFLVQLAQSPQRALGMISQNRPDLVVAAVASPGTHGIQLISGLRKNPETSSIPVIVLSERDDSEDRLKAFEAGIDDYLAKPFTVNEMLLRTRAVLRRAQN